MSSAIARNEDLYRYIPQRPPMVMVHALLWNDESLTRSSYTVPTDGLFIENGLLREAGLVENIAQTAATGVGHYAVELKKEADAPLGFIASIKDLEVHHLPSVGEELVSEVRVQQEVLGMTIIEGKVESKGVLLARCEMRIQLQEES